MRHGGDVETFRQRYGRDFIDFSSNINPFGIPDEIRDTIIKGVPELVSYPDIQYRKLKTSLAKYLNCSVENVVVGNGVMELVDHAISQFPKALICHPSFVEYEDRAKFHRLEIENLILPFPLEVNDSVGLLEKIKKGQVVILGNPNNPTGYTLKKDFLIKLYDLVCEKNAFLILDEAFYEFTECGYDSIELFNDRLDNIIILRAATKFFALPGLRLGYGVTGKLFKKKLEEGILPWSVNTLAMRAGQEIYKLKEYISSSQSYFLEERARIFKILDSLEEVQCFPSQANFILLEFKNTSGDKFLSFMLDNGIIVRTCDNYMGLDQKFVRFAIKSREENNKFLSLLEQFLKG